MEKNSKMKALEEEIQEIFRSFEGELNELEKEAGVTKEGAVHKTETDEL